MKKRKTVVDILQMKGKETISSLTAYDCVTAALLERAGCDILLVGDSLGNVLLGYPHTLQVTMEDMLRHAAAVARGSKQALLVADMPFLSYQAGLESALQNAGRFLAESGVQAVKIEGGKRNQMLIQRMVEIGIPVMGHIGMTPQSVHTFGGYRRTGKTSRDAETLMQEALAIEEAGAFAIVLECVEHEVAAKITSELKIPTIGIGSGEACDGQVLVINDLLGYSLQPPPGFVKPAIDLAAMVSETVSNYIQQLKKS